MSPLGLPTSYSNRKINLAKHFDFTEVKHITVEDEAFNVFKDPKIYEDGAKDGNMVSFR